MNLILKTGSVFCSIDDRDLSHVYNNLINSKGLRLSEIEQQYATNDNENLLHVDMFLDYKGKELRIATADNDTGDGNHFIQKPSPASR